MSADFAYTRNRHHCGASPHRAVGFVSLGSLGPTPWLLGVVVGCFGLLGPVQRALGQCEVSEQAKLTGSDVSSGGIFSWSVSISGDVALIGEPADGPGSAYVYKFNGTEWMEEAKLTASDGAANDSFGWSVAISGDVGVIGARGHDDGGSSSGSAYVFRLNPETGEWGQEAKLTASDAAPSDDFGSSVSISGDVAVIGAPDHDDAGSRSGSAYVYRFNGTEWTEEGKLTASDAAPSDHFGSSVSIRGVVAVIGAAEDDNDGEVDSGSAYVYRLNRQTGDWDEEAKLTASNPGEYDNFGYSVSISGDAVMIGAPRGFWVGKGSAYPYRFDGTDWNEEGELAPLDPAPTDRFGNSVSIRGNVAVIGAPGPLYHDFPTRPGSAYVYQFDSGEWIEEAKLTASDPAADYFGLSVSISEELAVIGRWPDDDGGSAFVFGGLSDCNDNDTLDACDIADGTSEDENDNGVPDECEALIPTVSQWGLILMTILLLIVATRILARRRVRHP